MNDRRNYRGKHILAKNHCTGTDTWETGLNNNVLVFGPTGSGKTRHYVRPNIMRSHESMIVMDTKGNLYQEMKPILEQRGFRVLNLDFTDLDGSCGYNPLDYIRYAKHPNEQDIMTVCTCIVPNEQGDEPYWSHAAQQYLACLLMYVLEIMPDEKHTLPEVMRVLNMMNREEFPALMDELVLLQPDGSVKDRWDAVRGIAKAEKMDASIRGILSTALDPLCYEEASSLYSRADRIDFTVFGKTRTALFLTVSDSDRSQDRLAGLFMSQALQNLMRSADKDYPAHCLQVPVRFYLDDFATNLYIPDFDRIISVIRSREISVSVILQSLTQLNSLYGTERAKTILNNCDQQLYLGGQDLDTASYIACRAGRTLETILGMGLDDTWLFIRGQKPCLCRKYEIRNTGQDIPETYAEIVPEPEHGF